MVIGCKPLSQSPFEPTSEQLWKHNRFPSRYRRDELYCSLSKFRWYRGDMRFRPYIIRMSAFFYCQKLSQ